MCFSLKLNKCVGCIFWAINFYEADFLFFYIFFKILSVKLVLLTLAVCFIPSIFWFICVLVLFWHATSTCRPVKWRESVGRKIHHVSHMFALKYKPNERVLLKGKKKNLQTKNRGFTVIAMCFTQHALGFITSFPPNLLDLLYWQSSWSKRHYSAAILKCFQALIWLVILKHYLI